MRNDFRLNTTEVGTHKETQNSSKIDPGLFVEDKQLPQKHHFHKHTKPLKTQNL